MPHDRRQFLKTVPKALVILAAADAVPQEKPESKATTPPTAQQEIDPFLSGNFAPVRKERSAGDLKVEGSLPAGLRGLYVRNGPNPQFDPKGTYTWLDGDAMLHAVRLTDSGAHYRNKWVRTATWSAEHKAGRALYGGMRDPLPKTIELPPDAPREVNRSNISLVFHHKKLLTLWEGGKPYQINVPSLDTVGPYDFENQLYYNICSHPKVDPNTGEMIFFGSSVAPPYVKYGICDPTGTLVFQTAIETPEPVLMHDFGLTEKSTVFCDVPMVLNLAKLSRGLSPWEFRTERPTRFGVMNRRGTSDQIKWFEAKACYFFHTFGAYEEGSDIVILAARYERFPLGLEGFNGPNRVGERNPMAAYPHRFRLHRESGKVTEESLDDGACEWPRNNDSRLGKPFRHAYAMRGSMDGLIKYDFKTSKHQTHVHGPGRKGGEGLFVPHPDAKAEDHGWVLCYVHDTATDRSELVILDAQDFTARPVAKVQLPSRVPFGFHGTWIPETALGVSKPG